MSNPSTSALRHLRRTRQLRRLGAIEWFDAAYRAYLVGIFGGGTVLWISSSVDDAVFDAQVTADVAAHGPAALGLAACVALLLGLRSGAQGGPISLEAADVVHVMLSPVDRRQALLRPAVQRVRGALFSGALAGGIVGQLAGRRLPGSLLAWAAGGAVFGATVALVWAGAALLAHTLRVPRPIATSTGLFVLVWQSLAVWGGFTGPTDTLGSLGLWGWRQHPIDLVPIVVALIATMLGLTRLRSISLEALSRRSALVAQLRFAVTMQDLRTVVLLRRQLNQEHARRTPWRRLAPARSVGLTSIVWRRGWHGLLRFPLTRIARCLAIAVGMGVLFAAAVRGTTPAVVGAALLGFMLGLELMEPLSQEVDQPDHTDGLPIDRGSLMLRHLLAPAVAMVPFAVVAALASIAALGFDSRAIAPAAILAIPLVLSSATGGVVSIVRDAPDPFSTSNQQAFVPPEMAGFSTTIRLLWPFVISTVGASPILLTRTAFRNGDSLVGAAVRATLAAALFAAAVAWWTKSRDRIRIAIKSFIQEGRTYTAEQRAAQRTGARG